MATQTKAQTKLFIGTEDDDERRMVIDIGAAKRRPALNERDARRLTEEIRKTSLRLWILVSEAYDRKAHEALGYKTWDDYVRGELRMSPSRAYQLLDTGHVMRSLAAAGVDVNEVDPPPARVVARVKDRLDDVREVAERAVGDQGDVTEALRELAREPQRNGNGDGNGDGNGEESEPPPEPPRQRGRPPSTVTCPACDGQGKVTRSLGARLRDFLKDTG